MLTVFQIRSLLCVYWMVCVLVPTGTAPATTSVVVSENAPGLPPRTQMIKKSAFPDEPMTPGSTIRVAGSWAMPVVSSARC